MKTVIALLLPFVTIIFLDDSYLYLNKAQAKINDNAYLSYVYKRRSIDPDGVVDTLNGFVSFSKKPNRHFGYDYVKIDKRSADLIYVDNEMKQVRHSDSTVVLFSEEEITKNNYLVTGNIPIQDSPITLLHRNNWMYKRDTSMVGMQYAIYRTIEIDTLLDQKRIIVEGYAYINKVTSTLDRYERRRGIDGKSSPFTILVFADYKYRKNEEQLKYDLPSGYRTQLGMTRNRAMPLKNGQIAPLFSGTDLQGKEVTLQSLRSKKTLLVFSTISCSYCKLALDHFNRKDYQLKEGLNALYIFSDDKKETMTAYATKANLPFPVLAGAKQTGKDYGVTSYPTFFLLNEQGVIEKVMIGYNEEFIESLRK